MNNKKHNIVQYKPKGISGIFSPTIRINGNIPNGNNDGYSYSNYPNKPTVSNNRQEMMNNNVINNNFNNLFDNMFYNLLGENEMPYQDGNNMNNMYGVNGNSNDQSLNLYDFYTRLLETEQTNNNNNNISNNSMNLFNFLNTNNDGKLNAEELQGLSQFDNSSNIPNNEAQNLVSTYNNNENNNLDFNEFRSFTNNIFSDHDSCTLSDGSLVPNGYVGNDSGNNYCNQCICADGSLSCTKMFCPENQGNANVPHHYGQRVSKMLSSKSTGSKSTGSKSTGKQQIGIVRKLYILFNIAYEELDSIKKAIILDSIKDRINSETESTQITSSIIKKKSLTSSERRREQSELFSTLVEVKLDNINLVDIKQIRKSIVKNPIITNIKKSNGDKIKSVKISLYELGGEGQYNNNNGVIRYPGESNLRRNFALNNNLLAAKRGFGDNYNFNNIDGDCSNTLCQPRIITTNEQGMSVDPYFEYPNTCDNPMVKKFCSDCDICSDDPNPGNINNLELNNIGNSNSNNYIRDPDNRKAVDEYLRGKNK